MQRGMALAIVLALALATLAQGAASAATGEPRGGGVTVDMTLVGVDAIDVVYRMPAACTTLPLAKPFDASLVEHLRKAWVREGHCGELDGDRIQRPAACREVRFRVPASDEIHDRVYPPAYPIDGLGVYAHTGLFAPTDACGPVTWRFAAPHGEVVFDGRRRGREYVVRDGDPSHASFASVYLSARPLPATSGPVTVYAPGVPAWLRDTLEAASHAVDARYRALADGIDIDVPAVVVSDREDGGPPRSKADVANQRMMRIGFKNFAGTHDDEGMRTFLRGLIAHEFAHVLQNPALGADEIAWEAEGGAEFMRWITLYRLGWRTAAESAGDLADALDACIEAAGERRWTAIPGRNQGRTPYACGLAIHALALASRKGGGSPEAALMLFYRAARNHPEASPAQWLECGRDLACEPRTIPALLDRDTPFGAALIAEVERLGVGAVDDAPPRGAVRSRMAARTFQALMSEDCNGGYSFNTSPTHIDVLKMAGCKSLHEGLHVTGFAGAALGDTGADASAAARAACARSPTVELQLDGLAPLMVACPALLPQPSPRVRLDAKVLFARLDRP
jgi:hypothetical protein